MSAKTKCVESFHLNDRVFAKMKSYPIWPAKIIEILDNDKYKVFFYGTHDCAVVPFSNVTKYEKLKNNIPKSKLKSYLSAVKEIKQDINNKLFSCEKIKKYQKNYANKNKTANVKTKNESEDTNNKKRKIVTNSISEKGAPSKKPKKNQKSVDFSIFTASELYLECSTPDNVPVRMHISDVLTKDILSTLPDYDKDPIKWKSFVLCIVDFIRCKIIKGEPVPHEVQNNIDVIIQNNKSQMNSPTVEKKSPNLIGATSTFMAVKENVRVKPRKRSQGSAELTKNSNHLLEITRDKIKKEISENEEERQNVINGGAEEVEEEEKEVQKDIESEENDELIKEPKNDEKETEDKKDLDQFQNNEHATTNENAKETEYHTDEEICAKGDLESKSKPNRDTNNEETSTEGDVDSNSKTDKEINATETSEVPPKPAESPASNEIIQRQSPLFKNEKLLAKYMNYFNKRKLKLDLTEINNHIAKVLESKQESNTKSEQVNLEGSGSEIGCTQEPTDKPKSSRDNEPKKSIVEVPNKVTNDATQTHQVCDDTNNNILSENTSEISNETVPSSKQNSKVLSNLANSSTFSSDNASCSYTVKNHADSTLNKNGVNVDVTNTPLPEINKEMKSNDSIRSNVGGCIQLNNGGESIPDNECNTSETKSSGTYIHQTAVAANSPADSKENTFCNETNQLCRDTIEELLKTNMCYERQTLTKATVEYCASPVVTHFNIEVNVNATNVNSTHGDFANENNISHGTSTPNAHFGNPRKLPSHFHAYGEATCSNMENSVNPHQYNEPANQNIEDASNPSQTSDLSESQLNDLVHELFQQECQALSLHVRLMQSLSFNKNQQSFCSEANLLNAVQILADLYHMRLNQFVLLRNPQLVFTCRLIAKCSRDFVDRNNNTNVPPSIPDPTSTCTSKKSLENKISHTSDTRISHCQYHARTLETTAIRFLQYVSSVFDFKSGLNFYDQFNLALAKFHKETKNMTWSDMIYLAEQCIRNNIW